MISFVRTCFQADQWFNYTRFIHYFNIFYESVYTKDPFYFDPDPGKYVSYPDPGHKHFFKTSVFFLTKEEFSNYFSSVFSLCLC